MTQTTNTQSLQDTLRVIRDLGDAIPFISIQSPKEVHYPGALKEHALDQLTNQGLLTSDVHRYVIACPACQSMAMTTRLSCACCRSLRLTAQPLQHHMACAAIFPHTESDNLLACPKCHTALTDRPDEFEAVGFIYVCLDCQAQRPEPHLEFECLSCGRITPINQVDRRTLHRYRLTQQAESILGLTPRITDD